MRVVGASASSRSCPVVAPRSRASRGAAGFSAPEKRSYRLVASSSRRRPPTAPTPTSSVATAALAASAEPQSGPPPAGDAKQPFASKSWTWRGFPIKYHESGDASAPNGTVVLVHGFGASSGHFRKNVPAIAAAGYRVLAPDVIGFGASAKPLDSEGKPAVEYSTALWRDFVVDFVSEVARGGGEGSSKKDSPVVLVGNSLGSLVALRAAAEFPPTPGRSDGAPSSPSPSPSPPIAGVALLNLAGGMNNKAASSGDSDWRLVIARPLFALIDFLLSIRPVATKLFDSFRSPESLRNVLSSVYVNQDAVDDALVELIAGPARDRGALEAFVAIITGDPGPRPEEILPKLPAETPLLFIWGTKDVFTPVDGPVGTWAVKLPETRPRTRFELIEGVGHCLHDEFPDEVGARLLPWLREAMPIVKS